MIDEEMTRIGWIFQFQPSQTPESNVKDYYVFPSLSKIASKGQERSNWRYMLKGKIYEEQ